MTERDLDRARRAWGLEEWSDCGVSGRPLSTVDGERLTALGAADPTFVWERRTPAADYFAKLIEFRRWHYETYGFGVHAIEQGGSLIGQCGLQALDAAEDEVEFAIFLSASVRGSGLGRCLTNRIVEEARKAEMSRIFAVVRDDNPEGRRMVSALGGKRLSNIEHFGLSATKYRIDL